MPKITKTKRGFNIQHTTREIWGVDDPSETITPKINDKFRFDDGTIGTITGINYDLLTPVTIEVNSKKFGYSTFAIADLTLYQAPVTSNAIWTVWTVKG